MKLKVLFGNDQDKVKITHALKKAVISAAGKTLEFESFTIPAEISVTFTDNEGIKALNKEYRNKDTPTDVLSFPIYSMQDGDVPSEKETAILGDVVISLEKVTEQAEEIGNSFLREASFLTVHSVLHLLGYDHETNEEDEKEMFSKQREIMKTLKVK